MFGRIQTRFSFWPTFALVVSGIIFSAIWFYILDAPLPKSWDEAIYFNRAHLDWHVFQKSGLRGLIAALRYEDTYHPPAYRMLALPYNLIFGVHPISLKAHALFFWCLTLWLIYLTGKSLAGAGAGAFAVIYLAICPIIIYTAEQFYTEYALYFAIAGLFLATVKVMQSERERFVHWVAFAGCVALGGLAKFSFFFILAPFALILLFLGLRGVNAKPTPLFLITSIGFGGLLLLPWWISNLPVVLDYLFNTAATFERHSLGQGVSLGKFLAWMRLIRWTVLGPTMALVALLLLAAFALRRNRFDKQKKVVIGVFLLSIAPTLIITFSGTNNNPRFVGPALFGLAIALGVIAETTRWLVSWKGRLILAGLIVWQLAVLVWPTPGDPRYQKGDESKTLLVANYTNMFRRPDQWDWEGFWALVPKQMERPIIGELGQGSAMNPPQINSPWAKRNMQAEVRLLWRYELGPIDWERVMQEAAKCHVIVTAPDYVGKKASKFDLDNQHNTEFMRRLAQDERFEGPIRLSIGRFDPVELVIFFTKTR